MPMNAIPIYLKYWQITWVFTAESLFIHEISDGFSKRLLMVS